MYVLSWQTIMHSLKCCFGIYFPNFTTREINIKGTLLWVHKEFTTPGHKSFSHSSVLFLSNIFYPVFFSWISSTHPVYSYIVWHRALLLGLCSLIHAIFSRIASGYSNINARPGRHSWRLLRWILQCAGSSRHWNDLHLKLRVVMLPNL